MPTAKAPAEPPWSCSSAAWCRGQEISHTSAYSPLLDRDRGVLVAFGIHGQWIYIHPDAELVIEGLIDPELLEPEGPFGESHGYIALEDFNMSMQVTAITHRRGSRDRWTSTSSRSSRKRPT